MTTTTDPITEADLYSAFDTSEAPAAEFLRWKANECGASGAVRALDVGCGPGRLLRALHQFGWLVTGLEPHPSYFEAAARIAATTPGIEVRRGGFADIEDRCAFELIAAINGPFQYLLTLDERRSALERMFHALAPGGVVVIDLANFLCILKNYIPPRPQTVPFRGGQLVRVMEHAIDFHEARFAHRDRFEFIDCDGKTSIREATHVFAMLSFPEISSLARAAGFADLRTYRSLSSRHEESLDGPRIVVCARRPLDAGMESSGGGHL